MATKYLFKDLLSKKVLILGDLGKGKTKLTVELLKQAVQLGYAKDITIIDMAPSKVIVKGVKVGGKILEIFDVSGEIRYLAPVKVETPRLKAKSGEELLRYVKVNRERIKPLIEEFLNAPSKILFINDVSIYLQSGRANLVISAVKATKTLIANGYYGKFFKFDYGTEVSRIERDLMDLLANNVDFTIHL